MPADLERLQRLQIMLSAEELAAVDDFRFQKRMPSRAAAVRELMKRGLSAAGVSGATANEAASRRGDGASGDANAEDGDKSKEPPADG
jgi:hypothetical protein